MRIHTFGDHQMVCLMGYKNAKFIAGGLNAYRKLA